MDIKDDKIHISTAPLDTEGEKIEPEQQAAIRELTTEAPLAHGGSEVGGAIPVSVQIATTVGALAKMARYPCGNCKHFDRQAWRAYMAQCKKNRAGMEILNKIVAELIATQHTDIQELHTNPMDGDFDEAHAINSLGVCRIITEIQKDLVMVHPLGNCPDVLRSPEKPDGAFEPSDLDAERAGSAAFDKIMRMAQGRE